MTIKQPAVDHIPALRLLWKEAFGDSDAFLDGFFRTGFDAARCRCTEDVAAALYWFDCTWKGKKLAYVYAVATAEASRCRGLCRMLMEDTHRHLETLGYAGAIGRVRHIQTGHPDKGEEDGRGGGCQQCGAPCGALLSRETHEGDAGRTLHPDVG